jgi:Protein of unknown function (DUF1800)
MRNMTKKRLGSRLRRRVSGTPMSGQNGIQTQTAPPFSTSPGGGQPRGGNSTVDYELSPWIPTASDPFDLRKAAHLMRRAGFGASPEQLEQIVKIGPYRTIDLLVIPSTWGLQEYGSQMLPSGEILNLHYSLNDQRAQFIHEMATTKFPLKEKMAMFWHDHFSVGANSSNVYPMLLPHINIFRRHGLGKFRDMLVEVSRDPAMLWWLDNRINGASGKINENYGREILELYTVGVNGGYTQTDVEETSKCFAGWSLFNYNKFRYNTGYATAGYGWKLVMGRYIWSPNQQTEGFILIDHLLSLKATSDYIVQKIWSYFVEERPRATGTAQKLWDDVVDELSKRWLAAKFDIRALMWVILSSNYFMQRGPRKLVKNPAEAMVGAIRNLGTPPIQRYALLGFRMEQMGLALLRYGNPSGLDDGVAWIDSQALINRSNFYDELTQFSRTADFRVSWNPFTELTRKGVTKSKAIVDHLLDVLVDSAVSAPVRQTLYDFMDYYDGSPNPLKLPYDNLSSFDQRRDRKVRGLVQLIMILPEYQIN